MRSRLWMGAAVAAATTMAVTAVPLTAANAAPATLTIQVGADSTIHGVTFDGMRFYAPPTMTVHKGDVINFDFRGFHTATLLPTGVSAEDWRMDNMGPGGGYGFLQPDSDDTPPAFQFNKTDLFPSDPSCGTTSNPCTYDGKSVVNSGVPINATSFAVTVNTNPGSSFWVLCLVHAMMQTRIQVVADNVATTTQAQIDSYRSATLATDRQEAASVIPKLQKQTRHWISKKVWVWDAYAGYDGNGWGLDAMFPTTLRIKRNQWVRWHFAQLTDSLHSVTFTKRAANKLATTDFQAQNVKCEGANGDTAPDAAPPAFCSTGAQNAEFEVRALAVLKQGTNHYAGRGFHSSGVRGPDGPTTAPYSLKFVATSSRTGFRYACVVHGAMMSGRVIVR